MEWQILGVIHELSIIHLFLCLTVNFFIVCRVHHKNLVRTADADQALYNLNQLKNTSHNLCVPGIELRVFAFNLANLKKDDEAAY